MVTILRWTGREAQALREALRLSVRDFHVHANLSTSSIADMEAKGGYARLRHTTQKILDDVLATAPDDARQRFCAILGGELDQVEDRGAMNRRSLLAAGGAAATAIALPWSAVEVMAEVAGGLSSPEPPRPAGPIDLAALVADAAGAKRAYQAGHYRQVLDDLPRLLALARATTDDLGCQGQQAAADIYQTACSVLLKLGEVGLALLAADRSTTVASRSGDPVTVGASARALAHALASNGHTGNAVAAALAAGQQVERATGLSTPTALAVYGALLLRASVLAADIQDRATALETLTEAHERSERLDGDDNLYGTYFCAHNVQLHRVSVAVRLGDAGQAVAYARQVDPGRILLRERRASYLLDCAHAFTQWGRHDQAFQALCAAEQAAPQELALRPTTRELVAQLHQDGPPRLRRPVRQLASRIGAHV